MSTGRSATAPLSFQVTGSAIACGSDDPDLSALFPYPASENWQKAIGAHFIWLSGTVMVGMVGIDRSFVVQMTLHAEDRYNFNPGSADISTGVPDAANGRFEVSGLAKQYMNYATLVRLIRWKGTTADTAVVTRVANSRERKPQDNLRVRNRI